MTNRREFLRIGIAAGAWPFAPRTFAVPAGTPGPVPLYKLIYDGRFSDSVAFGAHARKLGLPVQEIDGDITGFWYQELDAVWRAGATEETGRPVAIAGLTAHGPLFCLEQLGWERRLRVVFRAEHVAGTPGFVEHRLSGPLPMLRQGMQLAEAGGGWPRTVADIAAQCPQGKNEISSARVTSVASPAARRSDEPLYSWVIAPAVRADGGERT